MTMRKNRAQQAGAVIVKEAGGLFLGGVQSFARGNDHIGDIMMSRRYCVIRAVAPSKVRLRRGSSVLTGELTTARGGL
jgi:hypothetical protein